MILYRHDPSGLIFRGTMGAPTDHYRNIWLVSHEDGSLLAVHRANIIEPGTYQDVSLLGTLAAIRADDLSALRYFRRTR